MSMHSAEGLTPEQERLERLESIADARVDNAGGRVHDNGEQSASSSKSRRRQRSDHPTTSVSPASRAIYFSASEERPTALDAELAHTRLRRIRRERSGVTDAVTEDNVRYYKEQIVDYLQPTIVTNRNLDTPIGIDFADEDISRLVGGIVDWLENGHIIEDRLGPSSNGRDARRKLHQEVVNEGDQDAEEAWYGVMGRNKLDLLTLVSPALDAEDVNAALKERHGIVHSDWYIDQISGLIDSVYPFEDIYYGMTYDEQGALVKKVENLIVDYLWSLQHVSSGLDPFEEEMLVRSSKGTFSDQKRRAHILAGRYGESYTVRREESGEWAAVPVRVQRAMSSAA